MSTVSTSIAPLAPEGSRGDRRVRTLLVALLPPLLLAILTAALCRAAAGVSLGLFFGGVAFATLLVPPLVGGETSPRLRPLVPAAVSLGVALVWLTGLGEFLTLGQWLACVAALVAYAFALHGTCVLLAALGFNASLAGAAVSVAALLWLTWPAWLSHALLGPSGDALAAWLVPAHPLFAINGVLAHFDTWDRHTLAYSRLTVLNQDVFYRLPTGVLPTVLAHGLVAAATLALSGLIRRRRRRRRRPVPG